MSTITSLDDMAAWERVWTGLADEGASPVLVFKASPHCGVSRAAEARFQSFAETLGEESTVRLYRVDVINARPVSQRIAADTGVTHASPQALLIVAGRNVTWNASHFAIKEDALSEAVASA
jgi:bacillithiol system protein YtxJ